MFNQQFDRKILNINFIFIKSFINIIVTIIVL